MKHNGNQRNSIKLSSLLQPQSFSCESFHMLFPIGGEIGKLLSSCLIYDYETVISKKKKKPKSQIRFKIISKMGRGRQKRLAIYDSTKYVSRELDERKTTRKKADSINSSHVLCIKLREEGGYDIFSTLLSVCLCKLPLGIRFLPFFPFHLFI